MSYADQLRKPPVTVMPWPHPVYTPMYSYCHRPHFWQKPYRGAGQRMVRRIALSIIFIAIAMTIYGVTR
jgi:hypothetical protein